MKKGKSLRNAFIRVSETNHTNKGVIKFSDTDILTILQGWTSVEEFYYIKHTPEASEDNIHYHIVIKFKYPVPFANVKAKFPYGKIENARSVPQCVKYLIHQEDLSKKQYPITDIQTNHTEKLLQYLSQKSPSRKIDAQKYIEKVATGEIREFEIFDKIPAVVFAHHKAKIDNAAIYFINKTYMDKDREVKVIFIYGQTGVGKTTLAKVWCKLRNKSYCISSSSNDPMQDYKCEDVLILDDLRDTDYKLNDLLKLLDNHTKSTSRSRFRNKAFIGDTIIITSAIPLDEWYFHEENEDKRQLRRRIIEYVKMDKEKVDSFRYDYKTRKYELYASSKNTISSMYEDTGKTFTSILEDLGTTFTPQAKKDLIEAIEDSREDLFKDL